MPFVTVKVIEGAFDDVLKRELVEQVAEAIVRVKGEAVRPITWVVVEEFPRADWYMGEPTSSSREALVGANGAPAG